MHSLAQRLLIIRPLHFAAGGLTAALGGGGGALAEAGAVSLAVAGGAVAVSFVTGVAEAAGVSPSAFPLHASAATTTTIVDSAMLHRSFMGSGL